MENQKLTRKQYAYSCARIYRFFTELFNLRGFRDTRKQVDSQIEEIFKDRDRYPVEFVDSIVIQDIEGLERIMQQTAEERKTEWGSLLKVHSEDGKAIVTHIQDPDEAVRMDLFIRADESNLVWDYSKADINQYGGDHHFHTTSLPNKWMNAMSYSVNSSDRCSINNWLRLITFTLPEGPEIIGLNRQFTYIPKEKDNKTVLVRADHKEIFQYLAD